MVSLAEFAYKNLPQRNLETTGHTGFENLFGKEEPLKGKFTTEGNDYSDNFELIFGVAEQYLLWPLQSLFTDSVLLYGVGLTADFGTLYVLTLALMWVAIQIAQVVSRALSRWLDKRY